ncbi:MULTISPECIES: fluoride efflux transporter CrcB [unclassified Paracoccus (in: a-proteobacteria)]|uniref:fluoride efflux transporter CrcB n=1 Tax=unclassified Paracoccus (in: a-proteobacteria) TaxID=2688777 RepID=UPI001600361F|nr:MULTISPECIES: fluoride efflux transporter CrcB [unclassified Paracoccus (in: a-proteobacteria)]MBB1491083.1 fluoride efflux transporter CrcB [Paracoccus sp. MC1854]MBB1497102.1 fluoride efflux transporter CrcB [Paracoccus sp. MC1862]QQO44500.1 fluoride efflux transporter CrcB [Paracoccus sp. MC1862]
MMTAVFQVALGGALGATARHGVNLGAARLLGPAFPWATLGVNVAGSFLMGLVVAALGRDGAWAPLLLTGMLGGFTTFSAFSLDAVTLWQKGQGGMAALYVGVSVLLSLAALVAGLSMGRPA